MKRLKALWARLQAKRRWQWAYTLDNGYYVVVSRLGHHAATPRDRWEIEITDPRGRTSLRYRESRTEARRLVREIGARR